jgi:hypothetical protein
MLFIIQDPIEAALVGATFSLTLGLFLLVLGFIYYPYLKTKFKHGMVLKEIIFLIYRMHIKFYPIIVR